MTNAELFKAAHKMAKINKATFGGDYVVYFSHALKQITIAIKSLSKESLFKAMNIVIRNRGGDDLITGPKKVQRTHGLKEFSHAYKLEKARRDLEKGQAFGKEFTQNGMICAWVKSTKIEQIAY